MSFTTVYSVLIKLVYYGENSYVYNNLKII